MFLGRFFIYHQRIKSAYCRIYHLLSAFQFCVRFFKEHINYNYLTITIAKPIYVYIHKLIKILQTLDNRHIMNPDLINKNPRTYQCYFLE